MQNLDSLSWLKSRASSIISLCTEWTSNRINNSILARCLGGSAYRTILTDSDVIPSLEVNAYNSLSNINGVPTGFTFTRASTATAWDPTGKLYTASSGELRHEWDVLTGAYKGWLIEGAITNTCLQSENISLTWSKARSTVAKDTTTAPDGTLSYKLIEDGTASNTHYMDQNNIVITANVTQCVSVFVKASERSSIYLIIRESTATNGFGAYFNLTTLESSRVNYNSGVALTSTITDVGNGWYRCTVTGTIDTTSVLARVGVYLNSVYRTITYSGDGTSGLYVWGIQVEPGYFPTSYIPTTTAAATRSADVLSILTSKFPYNASEGTLYFEGSFFGASTSLTNRIPVMLYTDNTNGIYWSVVNSSMLGFYSVTGGGWTVGSTTLANVTENMSLRSALVYKLNDYASSTNGNSIVTDTSTTVPSCSTLRIGSYGISTNLPWQGHIKHVVYFPKRLTNAELQRLTK